MAKTAGLRIVESDTAPGLGVVRKRAGHLKARAEELRRKVEVARTRDAEMEETLQERRDGLVEGTSSHEDVAAAAGKLDAHRAATRHLEEALGKVEVELVPLLERIDQEQHARERDAQLEALEPFRRRGEQIVDRQVDTVVHLFDPLAEHRDFRAEAAEECPNVRGVDPVSLPELAARTGKPVEACLFYLRVLLAGPDPAGMPWRPVPRLADPVQQALGIDDRS